MLLYCRYGFTYYPFQYHDIFCITDLVETESLGLKSIVSTSELG